MECRVFFGLILKELVILNLDIGDGGEHVV